MSEHDRADDRRALQDVARVAREAAARDGVTPTTAAHLERIGEAITLNMPDGVEDRGRPDDHA